MSSFADAGGCFNFIIVATVAITILVTFLVVMFSKQILNFIVNCPVTSLFIVAFLLLFSYMGYENYQTHAMLDKYIGSRVRFRDFPSLTGKVVAYDKGLGKWQVIFKKSPDLHDYGVTWELGTDLEIVHLPMTENSLPNAWYRQ